MSLSWAPSRRVFLRRVMLRAALTFALIAAILLAASATFSLGPLWAIAIATIITLGFALDDLTRWRNARTDRWRLEADHLLHDGSEGRARIPLGEIESVRARRGGHVVVRLRSGQHVVIPYLPFPRQTADQIAAAGGLRMQAG